MKRTFALTGAWQLKGEGIDPSGKEAAIAIDAQVPGHVHQDLLEAGLIADPGYRKQAEDCQWVEHWQWTYRRTFELERLEQGRPLLEFEGLDTYAEIELNGIRLARTDNMFIRYRFDISGLLRAGTNELTVRFRTVAEGLAGKSYVGLGAAFTSERLFVRRMQCTFGWDWVGRLVSYGIWRPVRIVFEDVAAIDDLFVYTKALDACGASLAVAVETTGRTEEPLRLSLAIADPAGAIVWQAERRLNGGKLELTADLAEPELWWPAGYGGQPLYTFVAKLYDKSGLLDERSRAFGIRTVRIEQLADRTGSEEARMTALIRSQETERDANADNPDGMVWEANGERPGSGFRLLVNGVPIFCKGANWVPCDPFPSRVSDSRYEHLLRLARDAGMTMLRCWGGGIYEPEPFWDWCDRLGIVVVQDFMMACGTYPESDRDWTASLTAEVEGAIRALRNHPSLVWWNGDNENGMFAGEEDPDYPGRAIAERITGRLCAELDPSRPFQPTSPYGGSTNNSFTIGTAHYTGALFEMFDVFRNTDLRDYRSYFAGLLSRFCPEFPMFGTPEVHTLQRMMNDEDLADPSYHMLEYHTKNHPGLKDFSLFRALATLADKLAPPAASTPEQIRRMSFVQHELTRLTVEAYRRNRHYAGGILFWMYNDCWPASGWSLVDYYGYPKGGYYGFKKAARPVIASIERNAKSGTYDCWVCSDMPEAIRGTGMLRILKLEGTAIDAAVWSRAFDFVVGAGLSAAAAAIPAGELDALLDDRHVLVMDIGGTFGEDRCVYFSGLPADMKLATSGLRVASHAGGAEAGSVTVTADRYAKAVLLHGAYVFSDNYFDLLPGELRTIQYRGLNAASDAEASDEKEIELIGWN
ncbi:beta-mannosidase [Cohnella sp. JJ-181]|uniref:beta-mannosidase n=1 Tax=Cohnella rhizoplanae TaxID=2974897 RepID=UPI0022FF7224|nr:glycoside hydrolase family 2 protein [Cohnella sp. JJ-181]CAI6087031.1 Exo-beta-D-glucosaminidase [Cohnella sp. JJ-181]